MAKDNATVVTKKVKFPLEVTMTGPKVAISGDDGAALVESLKAKLPLTFRLGRGRKETIKIGLREVVPQA